MLGHWSLIVVGVDKTDIVVVFCNLLLFRDKEHRAETIGSLSRCFKVRIDRLARGQFPYEKKHRKLLIARKVIGLPEYINRPPA